MGVRMIIYVTLELKYKTRRSQILACIYLEIRTLMLIKNSLCWKFELNRVHGCNFFAHFFWKLIRKSEAWMWCPNIPWKSLLALPFHSNLPFGSIPESNRQTRVTDEDSDSQCLSLTGGVRTVTVYGVGDRKEEMLSHYNGDEASFHQ